MSAVDRSTAPDREWRDAVTEKLRDELAEGLASVVARRWIMDGLNAEVDAWALVADLREFVARQVQAARADALDDVAQILPQLVDDSDPSLTALVRLVADALSVRAALTRAPRAATIRTEQEDQT